MLAIVVALFFVPDHDARWLAAALVGLPMCFLLAGWVASRRSGPADGTRQPTPDDEKRVRLGQPSAASGPARRARPDGARASDRAGTAPRALEVAWSGAAGRAGRARGGRARSGARPPGGSAGVVLVGEDAVERLA